MDKQKISTLGRPVDPKYPTNLAIIILTVTVFTGILIYAAIGGDDLWNSILRAVKIGAVVFFSWAICREIDPDHEYSALVASAFGLGGSLFFYPLSIAGSLWLVLLSRLINRTTGLKTLPMDAVILSLLSTWLLFSGSWIYGAVTALALFADSRLKPRNPGQVYFALGNALIICVIWILKGFDLPFTNFPPNYPFIFILTGVLFIPLLFSYRNVTSKGDQNNELLKPARVITAQILALITGLYMGLLEGYALMLPLYAAIAGASVSYYFRLFAGMKPRT